MMEINLEIIPDKKYIISTVSPINKETINMNNIHGRNIEAYCTKFRYCYPKSAIFINDKCVFRGEFSNSSIKQYIIFIRRVIKKDSLKLKFVGDE